MNSSSRNGARVIWLAVHTTEGIMRAADLRDWKTWAGSSHASSDETGVLMTPADGFVPYNRMAWTLRNGNPISDNIEQCGWARWTRAEWLARPKLLDATARWLAERSKARGIPLVHLSLADIRARKPGVIGHGDYSVATGDGTHTDPGPNYPWDVVIDKARAYAANEAHQEDEMQYRFITQSATSPWFAWDGRDRFFVDGTWKQTLIDCGLAYKDVKVIPPAMMAKIPVRTSTSGPSAADIAEEIVAKLPASNGGTVSAAQIAEAVVDLEAARLTS